MLGGTPSSSTDITYSYTNNRRTDSGFTYDAAGNLTFDGGQHFTYDAQGSQVAVDWMNIQQGYDGDGLRVRRTADGKAPARYLRSSVLGGQVVAELNQAGGVWEWVRGYVYGGAGVLAVQQGGAVSFVHEDPVTKAKRVTDTGGSVQQSATEVDPFGAEAGGTNQSFQPHTNYRTLDFDKSLSTRMVQKIVKKWADYSRLGDLSPHDLRRTAITRALDAGLTYRQVQMMSKHRDPKTVMRYDHGRENMEQNAVNFLEDEESE